MSVVVRRARHWKVRMPRYGFQKAADDLAPAPEQNLLGEPSDFSLVLGGPLFQLLRKAHLEGDHLELLYRRVIVITGIAWLPLFVLATLGPFAGSVGRLAFLRDVEVQTRFLIALPILIVAELIVNARLTPLVRRFVERRIVLPDEFPRFNAAIQGALTLRNSVAAELVLVGCVYIFGLWLWNDRVAMGHDTWYAAASGRWALTPAGIWYVFISLPIAQFILLRWYMRFFIWFRFLWHVSRLKLNLIPSQPDRCAGIGFLGKSVYAFGPILFAQGAMLAGVVASRVLYRGENLLSFKLQIGGFIVFFVAAILGPLLMFTPQMAAARRKGLAEYGLFAQRYVQGFHDKWILSERAPDEELLGTGDIQSLADLGNSYGLVRDMRVLPFGLDDITRLAVVTAAPFIPLLLTIWSPEELIMRIVKVVF
jgi:hypothetical protein